MTSGKLSSAKLSLDRRALTLFGVFSALVIASFCAAFAIREPALMAIPLVVLIVFIALNDIRRIYLLLLFAIPLSVELELSGQLSTNLPDEPLMVATMLVLIFYVVQHPGQLSLGFLTHPLIILLCIQLFWIAFTTFFSEDPVVSIKFFVAKLWYVASFVFMTGILVQHRKHFLPIFWCVITPLVVLTLVTIARHYTYGFHFDNVNDVVTPYFRNHVNYAALLTIMLPFVWFARFWHRKGTWKSTFLRLAIPIMLAGIFFAFTRGAWLAVIVAILSYYAIRLRVFKIMMIGGMALVTFLLITLLHNNRYLNYAPDFETTIYHETLAGHMAATAAGFQDVSSAERIYRWVAAKEMFEERPWLGVGPGNFYPSYKEFTVRLFETYISDNEERSTVHNYFLLALVEQGLPGFAIFLVLSLMILFYGNDIYHRTRKRGDKQLVMAIVLSMVILMVQNMLSDLVESDKVGSIFFLNVALLVIMDLRSRSGAQRRLGQEPAA